MKSLVQFINEAQTDQVLVDKFTELFGELGKVTIYNRTKLPQIEINSDYKNTPFVRLSEIKDTDGKDYIIKLNNRNARYFSEPRPGFYGRGYMAGMANGDLKYKDNKFPKTFEGLLDFLLAIKQDNPKEWDETIDHLKNDQYVSRKMDELTGMSNHRGGRYNEDYDK